jgi:beta-lactamase class A
MVQPLHYLPFPQDSPDRSMPDYPLDQFRNRRSLLLAIASVPLLDSCGVLSAVPSTQEASEARFRKLETSLDGRLGVFALDTGSGKRLAYRAAERFPMCSTFKAILAGAILERSTRDDGLLARRIPYAANDLVSYSPITEKNAGSGMLVSELCAAAVRYSDNTAANLLLTIVGGPAGLNAYARSAGDASFRLDRWETDLNSALPDDPRDTTTPEAMTNHLFRLVLGTQLPDAQRLKLQDWLRGNTTGDTRIRAGVPVDWTVGDKTGTGSYGTANDIAVLWPPQQKPIVLTIFTTRREKDAEARNDILASAAKIVADALGS